MQVRGAPRTLHSGQPLCAPVFTVIVEAFIQLLRQLHKQTGWMSHINQALLTRLQSVAQLVKVIIGEEEEQEETDKNIIEEEEPQDETEEKTKNTTQDKEEDDKGDGKEEKEEKAQIDG